MIGHREARGGVWPCLLGVIAALGLAAAMPTPGAAQTLGDLVSAASGTLTLPPGKTLGRADIAGTLVIEGVPGSTLSAPEDDAILAVLPGADLRLAQVALVQEGRSRFAIHIDGGSLELEDCQIEGAFEVSIYVSAGSLTLRDCQIDGGLYGIQVDPGSRVVLENVQMTGQGSTAIQTDGSTLTLQGVTVADSGENGIIVLAAPDLQADGVTITGILQNGLWLQDAAAARLSKLVVQVSGQAMTAVGGGRLALEGVVLQGNTGALALDGVAEAEVALGRLQAAEGASTVVLSGVGAARFHDLDILGGEAGLYVTGTGAQAFDRLLLHGQSGVGVYLDTLAATDPPRFADLRVIAAGGALPAYFRDSGPVILSRSVLATDGALPFAVEGASLPRFEASRLISAPEWVTGSLAFAQPDAAPIFLPTGDLAPLDPATFGPGTRHLALADVVRDVAMDADLRQAVADFATRNALDAGLLALALTLTLPLADLAPEGVEITLASPEEGWLWDSTAIQIALTGADGKVTELVPGDFPVTLPAGDYDLALDGRSAGRVTLAAGSPLSLPLPDAPFYAWRDAQGQNWRGPALYLRPADDLAALLEGFRPLRIGEAWGSAPAFAAREGADRALAATTIATGKDALPAVLEEMATLRQAEAWAEFNRRWHRVDLLLDLMAQFGTPEDAAWLVDLPVPEAVQVDQLETALLIEMRLGLLRDGATLPAARALLAAYLAGDTLRRSDTIRLVRGLARSGLPEGMAMLADLQRALRDEGSSGPPDPTGIVELSRGSPDGAGDIPAVFLDQLAAEMERYLSAPLAEGKSAPLGTDLWTAAVAALAYEAVHHPGTSRRLPVPMAASVGPSAWAFDQPQTLMLGPLALIGPPDPQRLSGWTYRLPEYLCAALAYRPPADRQAVLDGLRLQVTAALTNALTAGEDAASYDETWTQVTYVLDLTLGECVLSDAVLNSHGRDAIGEEQAVFDKLDYEPLWWLRLPRTQAQLAAFARGEDFPVLYGHSAIPLGEVEALLADGDGGYPPLRDLVLIRHQLISDAFHAGQDGLTFGSERRQFRLRNDGGNGSVTIAGALDIRPILSGGRLILAIRHAIQSPDYGGLAAMITEPDRTPYEIDHRRAMFEAVTLDRGGTPTTAVYEGTSASGVHFFAAPWQGDLSDTVLHLSLRFWDATWQVDVPLWASVLAHDLRQAEGGAP